MDSSDKYYKLYKFFLQLLTTNNFEEGATLLIEVVKKINELETNTQNKVLESRIESLNEIINMKDERIEHYKLLIIQNEHHNYKIMKDILYVCGDRTNKTHNKQQNNNLTLRKDGTI